MTDATAMIGHGAQHRYIVAGLEGLGFNVVDYGAVGDGSTDDKAAIQAALDAASAAGGGLVVLPHPSVSYALHSGLTVATHVSMIGIGAPVQLKATAAYQAMISVDETDVLGNRYGRIENLHLDGNSLANVGFDVGLAVQRTWQGCRVTGCLDVGWTLRGSQNNLFVACDSELNGATGATNGGGVRFNWGAGNNTFLRCEINENRCHQIVFAQSGSLDTSPTFPGFAQPERNIFIGCVVERVQSQTTSQILFRAGQLNVFQRCDLEVTGARQIVNSNDADVAVTLNTFDSCRMSGDASATAYLGTNAGIAYFRGLTVETFSRLFDLDSNSYVYLDGHLHYGGVTTFFNQLGSRGRDELVLAGFWYGQPEFQQTVTMEAALKIRDGISAPATVTNYAQIYVDVSDGDLKIKFGDGTVKTIVVDT